MCRAVRHGFFLVYCCLLLSEGTMNNGSHKARRGDQGNFWRTKANRLILVCPRLTPLLPKDDIRRAFLLSRGGTCISRGFLTKKPGVLAEPVLVHGRVAKSKKTHKDKSVDRSAPAGMMRHGNGTQRCLFQNAF
jgi:hypothetical protein